MKFKGTKGKWRKFQLPNGNMKITCDDWREFAEIEFKHWQNTEERRKQCLYNALLISKAPEILEMLQKIVLMTETCNGTFKDFRERYNTEIKQLIKEATEL